MEYVGIHEIFRLGLSLMDEEGFEAAVEDFRQTALRYGSENRGRAVVEVELGEPLNLGDDRIFWTLMQYVTARTWQSGLRDLLFSAGIEQAYLDRLRSGPDCSNRAEYQRLNEELRKALCRDYGRENGRLFRRAALVIDCRMYWDARRQERLLIEAAEEYFHDCEGPGLEGLHICGRKAGAALCRAYAHCLEIQRRCLQEACAAEDSRPGIYPGFSSELRQAWEAFCSLLREEYPAAEVQREAWKLALGKFCHDSGLLFEEIRAGDFAPEGQTASGRQAASAAPPASGQEPVPGVPAGG